MDRKMKTIGLLRFSVLTPTYYHEKFDSLEAIAEHIFSPERMELRFHLFEKLCLPSLTGQSDPDFDAVVLTAQSMPAPYLERLHDLIDPVPNIHLSEVGTEKHYPLLCAGYNSIPLEDHTHRIMFRLDDDDAVDKNFVKRTKRLARGVLRLQGQKTPTIISYNRGFYVRTSEEGNEVFDSCERAPLSTGTTLVAPVDHPMNPYRYVHRKFPQHFNTYSDISVPSFIRTIHGDNKSNPTLQGITHKMKPDKIDADLHEFFDTSLADLMAL